jgi:hypothetical protein
MNLTKFVISDTQYLIINPECIHPNECEVCAKIDIDYVNEEKNISIRFGYEDWCEFCRQIGQSQRMQDLIQAKMILDEQSAETLGMKWNELCKGVPELRSVDKYHFWSNSHKHIRPYFSAFLYNDEHGNVIFQIAPFYPFLYETKKSHSDFITYKKFMKDYKLVVKTTIPKENLKQWIKQAQELIQIYFPQFADHK